MRPANGLKHRNKKIKREDAFILKQIRPPLKHIPIYRLFVLHQYAWRKVKASAAPVALYAFECT